MKLRAIKKLWMCVCCAFLLSAPFIVEVTALKIPILMYHNLTTNAAEVNELTILESQFRYDMEFLQQFGYTPLLPADLLAIKKGSMSMPKNPVMITFDDGYRSNHDLALPILRQTGMKAAVAVVTSNIQNADKLGGAAAEERTVMNWAEVRALAQSGVFEVGSHTHDLHNRAYFGNLSPDGIDGVTRLKGETEQAYKKRVGSDLSTSIQLIKENTGQAAVNYFAYPFGAFDTYMPALLSYYGVEVSTLTKRGNTDWSNGLHKMPRYSIVPNLPISSLLRQQATAIPSRVRVKMNGEMRTLPAYEIMGSNYVRVRDVADLLKDTRASFDVQWDAAASQVTLTTNAFYSATGTENAELSRGKQTVWSVSEPTMIDGTQHMVAAFNIDANTFYKLRSLGDICGFRVDWEEQSKLVVISAEASDS